MPDIKTCRNCKALVLTESSDEECPWCGEDDLVVYTEDVREATILEKYNPGSVSCA
jgi:RNA polymerase subunit RPABC4/transcription elongation factor Spt4